MRKVCSLDNLVLGQECVITYRKKGATTTSAYTGKVIEHGTGPSGPLVKLDTDRGPRSFTLSQIDEILVD